MSRPVLIGLSGFRRCGKDTAAAAIVGEGFMRVAFADEIYAEVHSRWPVTRGIPDRDKDVHQKSLGGISKRDLLLQVGEDRRKQDPMHWIKIALTTVKRNLQNGCSVVITDLRLVSEIDAVRALGGYIVWIERPGLWAGSDITEQDRSTMVDAIIRNDTSPEDFGQRVIQYAKAFRAIGPKWTPIAA